MKKKSKLICNKHPKYKAYTEPRKTKNHPLGCIVCWALYYSKRKTDTKTPGWDHIKRIMDGFDK